MNKNDTSGAILRQFIDKIERLEVDKSDILASIREVYSEAKSAGYDPQIMKRVVRERKMRQDQREELEALLDTYKHALGMI